MTETRKAAYGCLLSLLFVVALGAIITMKLTHHLAWSWGRVTLAAFIGWMAVTSSYRPAMTVSLRRANAGFYLVVSCLASLSMAGPRASHHADWSWWLVALPVFSAFCFFIL
jgi:hypothetical protein